MAGNKSKKISNNIENKGEIVITPKTDWQYRVNVQYDIEYACRGFDASEDEFGCSPCDDYCRCGTIVNARVEKLETYEAFSMANEFFLKGAGEAGKFGMTLAVRFFRHALDEIEDMFEVIVESGYYGEEIGGVRAIDGYAWSILCKRIEEFNLASNSERVKLVLTLEYGSVLPVVAKYDEWQLVEVPVGEVYAAKDVLERTHAPVVHQYQSYTPWNFPFYRARRTKGWFPGIVVVPRDSGDGYRIVDGFHRYKAWTEQPNQIDDKKWKRLRKNKKITVIMPVV